MLARSKLNSMESKISEAFANSEISHENFMILIFLVNIHGLFL